jgi:hypothetical protein
MNIGYSMAYACWVRLGHPGLAAYGRLSFRLWAVIQSGDVVAMLRAYQTLKESK